MRRLLVYMGVAFLACGCGLDEPASPQAAGSPIDFSASKMRVITKAGDSAEPFAEGTKFRLFAVQSGTDWSAAGTKFYNVEGTGDASGNVGYSIDDSGKKASYDVGKNLDFYGVTYGTSEMADVAGSAGYAPEVHVSLSDGTFPDLMYSSNLKNKNSSSGLLRMEFRHAMSKLKFEVLKQDETADTDKKLEKVVLKKVVLKGTAAAASFNVETGGWTYSSVADRMVFEDSEGMQIGTSASVLKKGTADIEMLVVPNVEEMCLDVTVDLDGDPATNDDKTLEYKLMSSETDFLKLEQNHEYTLSIVVLKNDVRVVTVTPRVYEWIDVNLTAGDAYFGQPVYFGGLMWMDRNLGAKSADCENDWYNSIGYYYQFGRNIPFILDVDAYLASFSSLNGFSFKLSKGTKGDPDAIYEMRAIYTLDDEGKKVTTAKYADRRDGTCLYDHVAINPGETDKEYSYIMGLTTESTPKTWAITSFKNIDDRKNENHIYWQNGDILNVDNQPCPKGWRLPTKEDLYSFMPEDNKLLWNQAYVHGEDMRKPVVVDGKEKYKHSEDADNKGKWNYKWSYFSGKFDVDAGIDKETEFSYPVKNANFARVFGIKYSGEQKAYRVMFEQRASTDGKRTYVRIYRFDTYASDEFRVSDDGTQWNLHKFDWTTPAEYMDIPLSGFMHNGGFTQFGTDAILRASTPSTTRGWNWTLYFRSGSNGVCVTDNTRRNLGENIRCVRDVNAK